MTKSSHRIRVLGREIQVRSSSSSEAVTAVEEFVNNRLAEVAVSLPNADQQLVTLLTLLNITESYLALQRGDVSGNIEGNAALQRIAARIDRALGDEVPRRVNI